MSGGGGGVTSIAKKAVTTALVVDPNSRAAGLGVVGYNKVAKGRGYAGQQASDFDPTDMASLMPEAPTPDAAPTMEDIASREPDKERRRRQRMAALMAQGRQGSILTGPAGATPNNSIGGGGKQMVGA